MRSTKPSGESVAIHPKVVRLFETLSMIRNFIVSVANHAAANPEIISAVNIKENTLEIKLFDTLLEFNFSVDVKVDFILFFSQKYI
tara:strand:- start:8319 stop:8576 length:258 start_codon:yes stop_codon:yes gene_type:complete